MEKLYARLNGILSCDPGSRGLIGNIELPDLKMAAGLLKNSSRVLIITGFPITGMGIGETDGPIGAAAMAYALMKAGKTPFILTDKMSSRLCAACMGALGLPTGSLIAMTLDSTSDDCQLVYDAVMPDLIISIERPGKGKDGHFHNMRGELIDDMIADTDWFMTLDIPTIAIGDGGNELGMGAYFSAIKEFVPHGELIAAEKGCIMPLVAGVSNWWGWGVSALVAAQFGKECMTTEAQERAQLAACVAAGGVDGVLKQQILSVDGMMGGGISEIHAPICEALSQYLSQKCE